MSTGKRISAYREDIDGLRAIAVLGVLFAHAKFPMFSGGFVGVDVFFVISGYLITNILIRENETDRFSLAVFYERRVRRIFPALYFMLFIVTTACWFIIPPFDFKEYGEGLASVTIFLSNFYFDMRTGYFNVDAEYRPLLHTWSLGVEEQFYVVFPILLALIYKFRLSSWKTPIFLLLWIISFGASVAYLSSNAQQVFYLPWFRAWELLTGSLVAVLGKGLIPWIKHKGWIAMVGLIAVIAPMLIYTEHTPFPSYSALPPVIGTALIILSGESSSKDKTLIARFLALPPILYIGTISYSLYLWHWPPIVFMRYIANGSTTIAMTLIALGLAFLLAILSYHFVEQPFRKARGISTMKILATGVTVSLVTFAFGVSVRQTAGMPWRLPDTAAQIGSVAFDRNPKREACIARSPERIQNGDICIAGAKDVPPTFAILGDSFADAFVPGVTAAAEEANTAGYVLTYGGCTPAIGTEQMNGKCDAFYSAAVNFLEQQESVKTVILIARWSSAFEASRFGLDMHSDLFITDAEHPRLTVETTREVIENGLRQMLERLNGKSIFMTAFIPEQPSNVPRTLGVNAVLGQKVDVSVSTNVFEQRQRYTRQVLETLSAEYGYKIIDIGQKMCGPEHCPAANGEIPLYVDDNHISRTTAIKLHPLFAKAVNE